MIKEEIIHGWTLQLPSEKLVTLTNKNDMVGIMYNENSFGDLQTLLLNITKDSVDILSMPHFINNVKITLDKQIILFLSPFILEAEAEAEQEQKPDNETPLMIFD